MHYVISFFAQNMVGLMACIGLLVVMNMKSRIGEKSVWPLRAGVIVTMTIMVSEFIDNQMSLADYAGAFRYLTSTITYILRPLQCLFLIYQIKNDKKWNLILAIPCIIYAILFIINLWTHFIFAFTPNFGATAFGKIRIYFPICYIALVFISSLTTYREKEISEIILVCILGAAIVAASLIEWNHLAGYNVIVINSAVSICYVFYYLYLHVAASKKDPLTSLYNRQTYYDDLNSRDHDITAVVSIDMNDLKILNDTKGHQAGDEGLQNIGNIYRHNRTRKMRMYRTGGDEFIILGFGAKEEDVKNMIASMQDDIKKTEYSYAFGYSMRETLDRVSDAVALADSAMYENKRSMKTTEVR